MIQRNNTEDDWYYTTTLSVHYFVIVLRRKESTRVRYLPIQILETSSHKAVIVQQQKMLRCSRSALVSMQRDEKRLLVMQLHFSKRGYSAEGGKVSKNPLSFHRY